MKFFKLLIIACLFPIINPNITIAQWVNVWRSTPNCIASNGTNIVVGDYFGTVSRSTDCGASWIQYGNINGGATVYSLTFAGNYLFSTIDANPSKLVSSDYGNSWVSALNGIPSGYLSGIICCDTNIIGFSSGLTYLFSKNYKSWTAFSTNLPSSTTAEACTAIGKDFYCGSAGNIYKSTDNGLNWNLVFSNLAGNSESINTLVSMGSNLFAGTAKEGIFFSTDFGASWTAANNGITDLTIISLSVSGSYLFANSNSKCIFVTSNNGNSWIPIYDIRETKAILDFKICGENIFVLKRLLLPMTHFWELWRNSIAYVTEVEKQKPNIPTKITLDQNFPNPFNPETTIYFSISAESHVTLKIYDVLGKEVSTLVSEKLPAGSYTRQWNALNMANGIYFYTLQAGNYNENKKMILLK